MLAAIAITVGVVVFFAVAAYLTRKRPLPIDDDPPKFYAYSMRVVIRDKDGRERTIQPTEPISISYTPTPPSGCDRPPPGWVCTRTRGHDGPCAAWPTRHRK